jgi:hypothetical protein
MSVSSEIRCDGLFYSVLPSRELAFEVEIFCSIQGVARRTSLVVSHRSYFFGLQQDVHPVHFTSVQFRKAEKSLIFCYEEVDQVDGQFCFRLFK